MDLFSQAEHDEIAQAILLTPDAAIRRPRSLASMRREPRGDAAARHHRGVARQPRRADRRARPRRGLRASPTASRRSTWSSRWPIPTRCSPKIRHAGAIFIGHYSSESLGDYCAGPNHVLPTSRTARFSSPLGVYDFQKRSSLIRVSRAAARAAGRHGRGTLARAEGLEAHARSAELRLAKEGDVKGAGEPGARRDPRARGLPRRARGRHGEARRDGEPVPAAARSSRDETRAAPRAGRDQPLSRSRGAAAQGAACARRWAIPGELDVLLGNGSDEILQMIALALAKPGAAMLALEPSFVMYRMSAIAAGHGLRGRAAARAISPSTCAATPGGDRARTRPALTWIAYPNNPTGNLFPREAILRDRRGLARASWWSTRRTTRSRAAPRFLPRGRAASQPGARAHRLEARARRAAPGARDRRRATGCAEFDKLRLPYNVNVLTAAAAEFLLAPARGARGADAPRSSPTAGALEAGLDAIPGVRALPLGGQLRAGAPARRAAARSRR